MPLNGLMTGATRVLIVDDEQDIVEVLEKILEDEAKYEVEVAKGGFAAGVIAERFRPHVMLVDMHLADIDGQEVALSGEGQLRPAIDQGRGHERKDDRR
jgi:DNA-binding response OmpR family regulator